MSSSVNASVCYFPNGVTTGASSTPEFVPCDPSAAESACCALGESCVGNGLCYSDNGGIYRGACTDSTWTSSVCAKACISSSTSSANYGSPSVFYFLHQCGPSGDNGGYLWGCGDGTNCSDTNSLFALEIGGIQQTNITGNLTSKGASVSSSASAAAATSSSQTSASPATTTSSAKCDTAAIAAGIAIPLGVLLLLSLLLAFWEHRKANAARRQYAALLEHIPARLRPQQLSQKNAVEMPQETVPVEMDSTSVPWMGQK